MMTADLLVLLPVLPSPTGCVGTNDRAWCGGNVPEETPSEKLEVWVVEMEKHNYSSCDIVMLRGHRALRRHSQCPIRDQAEEEEENITVLDPRPPSSEPSGVERSKKGCSRSRSRSRRKQKAEAEGSNGTLGSLVGCEVLQACLTFRCSYIDCIQAKQVWEQVYHVQPTLCISRGDWVKSKV